MGRRQRAARRAEPLHGRVALHVGPTPAELKQIGQRQRQWVDAGRLGQRRSPVQGIKAQAPVPGRAVPAEDQPRQTGAVRQGAGQSVPPQRLALPVQDADAMRGIIEQRKRPLPAALITAVIQQDLRFLQRHRQFQNQLPTIQQAAILCRI